MSTESAVDRLAARENVGWTLVNRKASFLVLVGTVLTMGVFFFHVMRPFLLPLFVAAVLALLFGPLYQRSVRWLRGRRRIAAALMTVLILAGGLLPTSMALVLAGKELVRVGQDLGDFNLELPGQVQRLIERAQQSFTDEELEEIRKSALGAVRDVTAQLYERTQLLIANVFGFIVGLAVTALALYYFFAEGPSILQTVREVSPLENRDEETLFHEFERVSRGVVTASVVCAFAQAFLAGIGFAVVGIERLWLLSVLTMFFSLIPFLGAAPVWICVAISLAMNGDSNRAIFLAIYGACIISTADNLIRAYVLNGTASLHPLVALVSVLGALKIVGLWGVFIGPAVAALFYTLLKILHERMQPADGRRRLLTPPTIGDH